MRCFIYYVPVPFKRLRRMLLTSSARRAKQHAPVWGITSNLIAVVRQPLLRQQTVTVHNSKGEFITVVNSGELVSKQVKRSEIIFARRLPLIPYPVLETLYSEGMS